MITLILRALVTLAVLLIGGIAAVMSDQWSAVLVVTAVIAHFLAPDPSDWVRLRDAMSD